MQLSPAAELYEKGIALRKAGRIADAAEAYRGALALQPDFPEAENNLGNCLRLLWRVDEAEAAFRRALGSRPVFPEAWNNLGAALKSKGLVTEALRCLERAVELQPDNAPWHSNLVYTRHYAPGDAPAPLKAEADRWNLRHGRPLKPARPQYANARDPEKRLRVGYVSAAFREQSQSFFTVPLLEHHDHAAFEIFGYADVPAPDAITARLRAATDAWRPIMGLNDEAVAEAVRADAIDVLVDLSVHAGGNRLGVFARQPAPVQVSWLGYPGTTGLETIGWRLTDPWLDPPGSGDEAYSEKSWRLPDTFWCYDPLTGGPAVNALPAAGTGRVTFGCLNNPSKLNDATLDLWAKVLSAVPASRLVVLAPPGDTRKRIGAKLEVGEDRFAFADFQPRARYLESYRAIDLCLDTFPYNGHTTSLDSWWMGVPVLSLAGRTAVSRAGLSQASNLGLGEWVADDDKGFVRKAVAHAGDLAALAQLRAGLRSRMARSPLMDGARFARNVEAAYRSFWVERVVPTR